MTKLRDLLNSHVLVADGAVGTMLQAQGDLDLEHDFQGLEGCDEVLNLTRPDMVSAVHRAYLKAGSDCVETNTFGTNLAALAEYGIVDRLMELVGAGARIARETADGFTDKPRFVLGSVGPGTKLPSLGHIAFVDTRGAYQAQVEAMIAGGIDAVQIETCQDLLQAKAVVIATKRARARFGVDLSILINATVETTGTMLPGSEIGAARSILEVLGVNVIGLNCAARPTEMSKHLRCLSRNTSCGIGAMSNTGLPELTPEGAVYLLGLDALADVLAAFLDDYGLCVIGGCCGAILAHIRLLVERSGGREVRPREVATERTCSSLYVEVSFHQDLSYLNTGGRTNANGPKAFWEAMLVGNIDDRVEITKGQVYDGVRVLDLCADYVGRGGISDMEELVGRLSTAVILSIVLNSTEPQILQAGLEKLAEHCVINSVNYEDGGGPTSRFARAMPLVTEYGAAVVALTIDEEGQARIVDWKPRAASRLIDELTGIWGMNIGDILVGCLTFPIATGQEETCRDGIETIEAVRELKCHYPGVRATLGVSNISFGLNPTARMVLNSVFLHECVAAELDSVIMHSARIIPMERIPEEQWEVALDLVWDRHRDGYDPLTRFLELLERVTAASVRTSRAAELAALSLAERLRRRIIDGEAKRFEADLDEALTGKAVLEIINEDLLAGTKVVGELFGSGQMQPPFVFQSAEVMETAVSHLEPHIDKVEDSSGKGTLVPATVRGDVHDIGKDLVDIVVSDNGYTVINIGIKQPTQAIIDAAGISGADAIGMSGLLAKSTLVMKDNLTELNRLGLAEKYPVLLGGATLTRAFVEHNLNGMFDGGVRYAKGAFEGLVLMDAVMAVKQGVPGAKLPESKKHRYKKTEVVEQREIDTRRPDDAERRIDVPTPPFQGTRVVKELPVADVAQWLDHHTTFLGRWGLKPVKDGPGYEELAVTKGVSRLRMWLDRITTEQLANFSMVYGYSPVHSEANTLIVEDPDDPSRELVRFDFPRQRRDPRLCLADSFRDVGETRELGLGVLEMQFVTMGVEVARGIRRLLGSNRYHEYLELHGLFVQLTEVLAESWHHRMRMELGFVSGESTMDTATRDQAYRGLRYSFGYPACPNMEDRRKLVTLLRPERIGVELSEELQLHPEQSTNATVVHHPQAKYFNAN